MKKRVQCGAKHCCVLSTVNGADSGSLSCWMDPNEDYGQADTSQLGSDVLDFSVGYYSTCALSASGTVTCLGKDRFDTWPADLYKWIGSFQISSIFNPSAVRLAHGGHCPWHFCLYEERGNLLIQCMYTIYISVYCMDSESSEVAIRQLDSEHNVTDFHID